ncbi:MAG: InlB B-repeat-containing protein, partial [Clostridia bacterium]|nr:InlB B-repeat-containing protein [Clostridia bacterium]
MKKKILCRVSAFMLAAIMIIGAMPLNVFAARCRHTGGKHWVNFNNQSNHVQICNECGARIKTEDHDVTDDSQWDFVYLDVDYDMSGGGTHQQICKKCGYTYYNEHVYEKKPVKINGANHPDVLICTDPNCNHIKEYDEKGCINYCVYYTKYVNFDYHVTLCGFCGHAPGQVYQHGFKKVENVDYSKLDEYYVFANNGAYKQYKYLSDAEKKLYKTFYTLGFSLHSHKADQSNWEKHNWYEARNASSHWMECHGCHATYDKFGHDFYTYEGDNQGFGPCSKTTVCETCGWVKSIKISNERNKAGTAWINFKEQLKTLHDILDYNGCPDEQPRPGHGGDVKPCEHPSYYTIYLPDGEQRVDNFYYLYIGDKQEKRCGSCNATLSTSGCSYHTETFDEVRQNWLKAVPGRIADLGADYTPWLYMEDYFKSGHYQVCSVCGGKKPVAHNWGDSKESDGDICKRTCKDCGFTITYRWRSEGSNDPSPHTYLTYQDNYWVDANQQIHDPDNGCCSYKFTGTASSHKHKAKCEICGYEHTEKCDTLGWCEIPGQPGKHLQFCSKCGGGKTVVDCGREYVAGDNLPVGFHAVRCPTCGDVYIPKTPCDFIIDEKNTDAFIHTYKCTYCGFEWHDNHIRKTIKTNVVPATASADGHYDLVTFCEVCNKEIARSTVVLPKTDNPTALGCVEAVYEGTAENHAHLGSGSSFLNGTMVMDGVAEYLANNSATLLQGVTFDPSHDFYADGKLVSHNSSTRIMLYANARMVVTDYTQDDDDLDGDNDKDEYTSMTATVTFTYSAYYVTTLNGVDYRDSTALVYNRPLDLSGAPITMTLPLLTGMSSNQTMFVRQTTDNGASYTTYLGDFDSDWGMACVTFTTENGFEGEFLFVPTEHWLEHFERQEATDQTDGNIEYWYDRGTKKYYSDILCEHEIAKVQTYLNANTYTISFASGGGSGSAPASITGVHKQEDVTLPACTYTNPGYVFYGWSDGDWTYKAGSLYTVHGDAMLTAKWHLPGDTMCHITFHPNGDNVEGEMDEQVCAPGDVIRLQENGYTREGYTFYGWSTTSERQVPPYAFDKGTISPETDLDLYAIWCPTYYITFDANGGEGEMEPQAYYSTPLLPGDGWYVPYAGLVNNTYTRDGYKFKYWAKNPDGSGDTYTDGGVSPMDTVNPQNITLYAIWEQTRFTVTFDANCDDATGETASLQFDAGIWDVIPQCGYEREGYVFVKWAENPDGTGSTTYKPGLLRTFYQDKTLYAVWQKTWSVTFDGNGADNTMPAQVVREGESTKLSEFALIRDGYQTVTYCWNTAPDGSGTKYYNGAYVTLNGDLTLYAQWKQSRFTITYDSNGGEGEQYTQTLDFGEGYSSVCPRCSAVYTHSLANGIKVNYCNCCGFAVALKDEGSTDNLATRSYGSLYDYNLPDKFDSIATLYAAFAADRTGENYTAFFEKAKEVLDGSVSALTKDLDYSLSDGAFIGIGSEYKYTPAETERTYADILAATAKLFGYEDAEMFVQYAQSVAAVYHANGIGASTSYRLKYIGAVYTANGSFILPYAFKTNLGEATLLSFVIVDADGGVSVWLSDLDVLFSITAYDQELPENSNTLIDVYGCCELYENPRALGSEFTKNRYVFSKWNTAPDGSGTNYTAGSTAFASSSASDLTLYAIWTPDFFTVTFDANGGEGTMEPQVIDRNVPTALNKNTFTREGYLFLGWGSSATATYGYNDEATYTSAYNYDVKLYARWAKAITITFDAGDGFGVMEPQIVAENTYTALNKVTFLHETQGFNYWSLTPNGERAYYATGSVRLSEDITLYAVWKNKSDASAKITFEDASFPYTGEVQLPEVTLASFTQYTDPTTYFLFYSGTEASRENWLPEAPTDVGVYTVRAIYEDSIYKGYKDATLTITKAERDLAPTSSLLLLYGKDKSIALRLSDGDDTALSDLTVTSGDGSVIAPRTDEIYKDGGLIIVPFSYVGDGYTTVTFTLPETANYEAASATITVLSKSGYNVTVAAADEFGNNAGIVGGTVTADKPTAPAGDVVRLSAQAKPGYTFAGFTVVNDVTGQSVEIENSCFTMPEANVTVSAVFTQNEYAISCAAVDGVTYGDLPAEAHYGDAITLSGTAAGNAAIKAYLCSCSGTSFTVTPDQNGVFRFIMPANDVTVTAVTGEWYDVSVSAGISGGSVAVSVSRAFEGMTVKVTPS